MGPFCIDAGGRGARQAPAATLRHMGRCESSPRPTSSEAPPPRARSPGAIADRRWELGPRHRELPLADGGEGFLDVLGGANRTTT